MVRSWAWQVRGEVDHLGESSSQGIGCLTVVKTSVLWAWVPELKDGRQAVSSFVQAETVLGLQSLRATIPYYLALYLRMPGVK